ncbi:uncharacterized protein LOC122263137 [Penaeus japonicus]|uniref:uncharacterized protein LOC122263137 n=1 Tax=Penaeus japonicus TaxID=27405 RepID=UPI001C7170B8|nr:uncharacterized protein LOC122263137 [Penaeus japonicus]
MAEVSPTGSPACTLQTHTRLLFDCVERLARGYVQSDHVKYCALEMYCRFAPAHEDAQIAQVKRSTPPGREREEGLRRLRARLKQQEPLRALTCLMIACKVAGERDANLLHPNVTPLTVQTLLETMGYMYTVGDIVRSEQRVLEQLEFRCFKTTTELELLELLMSAIVLDNLQDSVRQGFVMHHFMTLLDALYRSSVRLLGSALLNRAEIYVEFYRLIKGVREIHPRHR